MIVDRGMDINDSDQVWTNPSLVKIAMSGADKDGGNDDDDDKDVRGNNPTAARIGLSRIVIPC